MGTKYSSQSTSGYNSSPPVDDGTASEANKVKWATIKTKLADVLKTFGEAINTALVTALDKSARAVAASDSAAATDHDRTIQVNTSTVSVTLADATTMAAGYTVSVANQTSGVVTVGLATSTDTIDTVTNVTQVLGAYETRRYIVNATAKGYLTVSSHFSLNNLAEDTSPDLGADYVATYDTSGTVLKKVLAGRIGRGVLGTPVATTSGTAVDFTGIPSWVTEFSIMVHLLSTNSTSDLIVQIGDSGGPENADYNGAISANGTTVANLSTAVSLCSPMVAAGNYSGAITFRLLDVTNNIWAFDGSFSRNDSTSKFEVAGTKALSGTLTQAHLSTASGDTLDGGSANILYR